MRPTPSVGKSNARRENPCFRSMTSPWRFPVFAVKKIIPDLGARLPFGIYHDLRITENKHGMSENGEGNFPRMLFAKPSAHTANGLHSLFDNFGWRQICTVALVMWDSFTTPTLFSFSLMLKYEYVVSYNRFEIIPKNLRIYWDSEKRKNIYKGKVKSGNLSKVDRFKREVSRLKNRRKNHKRTYKRTNDRQICIRKVPRSFPLLSTHIHKWSAGKCGSWLMARVSVYHTPQIKRGYIHRRRSWPPRVTSRYNPVWRSSTLRSSNEKLSDTTTPRV